MLAFTGFVTSIVLLIIQFGTSEFSPRFLGWFRDPALRYALSAFIATFLFALVSTAQMGRGTAAFVPTRTLIAALLLMLLSITMFLLLIDRTSNNLRVAHILQSLDGEARAVRRVPVERLTGRRRAGGRELTARQACRPYPAQLAGRVGAGDT